MTEVNSLLSRLLPGSAKADVTVSAFLKGHGCYQPREDYDCTEEAFSKKEGRFARCGVHFLMPAFCRIRSDHVLKEFVTSVTS